MPSASVHKPTLPGGPRKPSVGSDKKLPAVEKYREAVVSRRDTKRVPCLPRHIDLHASDQLSSSGGDAIEVHVIFERVGAYRVIIIRRSKPDDYAGGLFDLAGIGHEAR